MKAHKNWIKSATIFILSAALSIATASAQQYNEGYNGRTGNKSDDYNYSNDDYQAYGSNYEPNYRDFYDALSPYGQWINDRDYGYVWVPDVGRNFRPYYTNGYWAQTAEYGNTWVSGYDWGWAAFHYGRWTYDNHYGWVWIPGTEWAPAWVNWRSSYDTYYGWAPMGPGYGVDYYNSNTNYYGPTNWWVFAPQQYLYSNVFYNYVRAPRYNNNYLSRSSFLNNSQRSNGYRYFAGPRRADIERSTGRTIPVYRINDATRPGGTRVTGGSSINIYKPRIGMVNKNEGNVLKLRPTNAKQGRLDIITGGELKSADGKVWNTRSGNNERRNIKQNNAGDARNQAPQNEPARGNNLQQQDLRRNDQQAKPADQLGRQTIQLRDQNRVNQNQNPQRQNDQRALQDQTRESRQIRQQQDQQIRQQQAQQRTQQDQIRQNQDLNRAQQTESRQQQDLLRQQQVQQQQQQRSQQQQQRSQQDQQARQQQEQMRQQQAQQREQQQQQRTQQEQPRQREEKPRFNQQDPPVMRSAPASENNQRPQRGR